MASSDEAKYHGLEIAVIGISGRFPGARTIDQLWQNLLESRESISFFAENEREPAWYHLPALKGSLVNAAGILDEVEMFDSEFFGFTPMEAQLMDPQQRLFLECSWEALEDAGYCSEQDAGRIGVYAGVSFNTYLAGVYSNQELTKTVGAAQIGLGNNVDFVSTNVSYRMNLTGPSYTILTACSSSLICVHAACQSLIGKECDVALAGGVSVRVPQRTGYLYYEGGILSPDGHCRALANDALGTVFSNGVGVVVLKRLADAVRDGDEIYAIIKGSASNNDGGRKVGFTAPSLEAQAKVVVEALANADVPGESISYVEMHGTGTRLGDAIEIDALRKAFQHSACGKWRCAVGSIKSNIGHLDAAAGIAGLIKVALSLRHRQIPASLHCEVANPRFESDQSSLFVNSTLRRWVCESGLPRRAGVSSFGIGGTNVHVVLEEAPETQPIPSHSGVRWQLLPLSAKTEGSLQQVAANLSAWAAKNSDVKLADVAYTLSLGRKEFEWRYPVIASSLETARERLSVIGFQKRPTRAVEGGYSIVFVFPGQGSLYPGAGWELYKAQPAFREEVDNCSEKLQSELGLDIRELLFAGHSAGDLATLAETEFVQPALFVIEYAVARTLMSYGIVPDVVIGHSLGEFVAACLAGIFDLSDALRLVARRGRIMQECSEGRMLAVQLPESRLTQVLPSDAKVSIAAINTPRQCVLSGGPGEIEKVASHLRGQEVACRELHTLRAFHSTMMDEAVPRFLAEMKTVKLRPPGMKCVSNLTGKQIKPEEATSPQYWADHMRSCVRFSDSVQSVAFEQERFWLEVGPGDKLLPLIQENFLPSARAPQMASTMTDEPGLPEDAVILQALGRLWASGSAINWRKVFRFDNCRRIHLPTYAFDRKRFWLEPAQSRAPARSQSLISKNPNRESWFYLPSWRRTALPYSSGEDRQTERWLVFLSETQIASDLVNELQMQMQDVVVVRSGKWLVLENGEYQIDIQNPSDYAALLAHLVSRGWIPKRILHMLCLGDTPPSSMLGLDQIDDTGFNSLLSLAKAIGQLNIISPLLMYIISTNVHNVTGRDRVIPARSMVLAPCRVIPQEYTYIRCRNIDIPSPIIGDEAKWMIQSLLSDVTSTSVEPVIAYRDRARWQQSFEPYVVRQHSRRTLRPDGVYVILGGLGRFGLIVAAHIAARVCCTLVLTGRSDFPQREKWDEWTASASGVDPISQKIAILRSIEKNGSRICIEHVDIADESQMLNLIEVVNSKFGGIHGVIHAAGVGGIDVHRSIQEIQTDDIHRVFHSKVRGLQVMSKILARHILDFCWLTSSLSPILGGLGLIAYSAANLYMDAVAHEQNQNGRWWWRSINWEGWSPVGPVSTDGSLGAQIGNLLMNEQEIGEVFDELLRIERTDQIVISTGDLASRVHQWSVSDNLQASRVPAGIQNLIVKDHTRPFIAPRNHTERAIAEIMQQLLGVETISVTDNLFVIGATSLLVVQLISRLRDTFHRQIPLRLLFDKPTISDLAEAVQHCEPLAQEDEIGLILSKVEDLTPEEVRRQLADSNTESRD